MPAQGDGAPGRAPNSRNLDPFQMIRKTRRVPEPVDVVDLVRGAGLRVTRPRIAALRAVHAHPHADTDSVIGLVRRVVGEVSTQAVYDVLRALTGAGLTRGVRTPP